MTDKLHCIPIGLTPILRGKEAADFLIKLYEDESKPAYPIPTPKLNEAIRLMKEHANRSK